MTILRFSAIALSVALALQSASPVAQEDAVVLRPLGDWETQRLDDRCIMRRAFGDPAKPTVLELRRIDPWDGGFHAAITSAEFALARAPLRAGWMPGGRRSEPDLPTYTRDADGREWIEFPHGLWDGRLDSLLDASARDQLSAYFRDGGPARFRQQVERFEVAGALTRAVVLQTGAMDGVVTAADGCMAEMLAARGVDPRDVARDASRAQPRHLPAQARLRNRLPDGIRTRQRSSMVEFMLYLDARARPTSCRLSTLPYDAEFEAFGCDLLMKNASFGFAPGERAQPTFFKASYLFRP